MQERILNIPNALTLARILLTPFIVYAILEGQTGAALLLMGVAGLTDMLDGAIARMLNQKSTVGAFMDPLADKLMLISAMVTLFVSDLVPLFLFLAVVFRDIVIVLGAIAYELVTHRLEMRPTIASKLTTASQIALVLAVLAHETWSWPGDTLVQGLIWLTFALTCISGVHYLVSWTKKAMALERN